MASSSHAAPGRTAGSGDATAPCTVPHVHRKRSGLWPPPPHLRPARLPVNGSSWHVRLAQAHTGEIMPRPYSNSHQEGGHTDVQGAPRPSGEAFTVSTEPTPPKSAATPELQPSCVENVPRVRKQTAPISRPGSRRGLRHRRGQGWGLWPLPPPHAAQDRPKTELCRGQPRRHGCLILGRHHVGPQPIFPMTSRGHCHAVIHAQESVEGLEPVLGWGTPLWGHPAATAPHTQTHTTPWGT